MIGELKEVVPDLLQSQFGGEGFASILAAKSQKAFEPDRVRPPERSPP
jgi:hypothetical protein